MRNDVCKIVSTSEWNSVVTSRWIYKNKHAAEGNIEKCKARFVATGFSKKVGVDYKESFAPITRYVSIREVISITYLLPQIWGGGSIKGM